MRPLVSPIIATADPSQAIFGEVLPWLIALLLFAVVGGIVIMVMRRWVRSSEDGPSGEGFTLHDLRQLHAAGRLSDEEFQQAKARLIERVKGATSENAEAAEPHDSSPRRDPQDADKE
jgi:membrane protein implicated in regulation of membrane protease activity